MSTDNPPAVDPEALDDALTEAGLGAIGRVHIIDAILSSGILRDADEVRREATAACEHDDLLARGFQEGWNEGRAELQAAIKALCDRLDRFVDMRETDHGYNDYNQGVKRAVDDLRALLADGATDALREVKAQAQREVIDRVQAIYDMQCPVDPETDYLKGARWAHQWWEKVLGGELRRLRDLAGEAGE